MYRRTVIFASVLLVVAGATTSILTLLEVITPDVMREDLGRLVGVIAVAALAVLVVQKLLRLAVRGSPDREG